VASAGAGSICARSTTSSLDHLVEHVGNRGLFHAQRLGNASVASGVLIIGQPDTLRAAAGGRFSTFRR
jgi:hypothetical protein